jgi:signal transduction histidine kinase
LKKQTTEKPVFRWHANGGEFAPYVGATMLRYNSPCGTVLDTNATQLMRVPERHYPFPQQPHKPIEEVLLVPFYSGKRPAGTVWAITHRKNKQFDNEDRRVITSLSRFAAAAVQNLRNLDLLKHKTDELMQESRRKTEFLAILSHELRNPLAPITNAVQVMRMSLPASDAKAFGLDIIARQSHQLHRIVDDLLDLSRASTNKMEMRTTRTNLTETIRTAIETSQSLMESQQHHFTANLPDKDIQLLADHARIAQAVSNLLNNATRYTPAGGNIDLTLRQDGNDALITIKDSGVGISREKMESIFELFAQAEKHQNAGLGIGLALARRIVELHRGRIEAFSAGIGLGSEFTIRLPLQ